MPAPDNANKNKKTRKASPLPMERKRGVGIDIVLPLAYAVVYVLSATILFLKFYPIGGLGVESDFYSELVVAAQKLWRGEFSVSNYPYKGPFYSLALTFVHLFGGDWYTNGMVLNLLCAGGIIVIVYRMFLRLFNRPVAIMTMIFSSLLYEFYIHSHKVSSDMLFLFVCYLAIYLLLTDKWSWLRIAGAGILSAFAFLTRYNGVFLPISTLIVLLIVNPAQWSHRNRLHGTLLYLGVFLVACAPWFIVNLAETGRILVTSNLQNIVQEFYSGPKASDIPEGGFESISDLIKHDPGYFVLHYLIAVPKHFWLDITTVIRKGVGILVVLGMLRFLVVPPSRWQRAFLVFPLCYFLLTCVVFHIPRFSLPIVPAYYAIIFSLMFGSDVDERTRFGQAMECVFVGKLGWLRRPRGTRFTPFNIIIVLVIIAMSYVQIESIIGVEKFHMRRRPLFILDAGRFLKRFDPQHADRVVMARKAHIAYYSGMTYQPYPNRWRDRNEFVDYAIGRNVDYVVYSGIESLYYGADEFMASLDQMEGIDRIYAKREITIFKLSEELRIRRSEEKADLDKNLSQLEEALKESDTQMIMESCTSIAEYCIREKKWDLMARCLRRGLQVVEDQSDDDSDLWDIASLRSHLAHAYSGLGQYENGVPFLKSNIETFGYLGHDEYLAGTHFMIHLLYVQLEQKDKAVEHLLAARELFISIGDQDMLDRTEKAIEKLQGSE